MVDPLTPPSPKAPSTIASRCTTSSPSSTRRDTDHQDHRLGRSRRHQRQGCDRDRRRRLLRLGLRRTFNAIAGRLVRGREVCKWKKGKLAKTGDVRKAPPHRRGSPFEAV